MMMIMMMMLSHWNIDHQHVISYRYLGADIDGILPKEPYPSCLRMADRACGSIYNAVMLPYIWFVSEGEAKVVPVVLGDMDGIPPKGPYLPCLGMALGPSWQDTIDMWWNLHCSHSTRVVYFCTFRNSSIK